MSAMRVLGSLKSLWPSALAASCSSSSFAVPALTAAGAEMVNVMGANSSVSQSEACVTSACSNLPAATPWCTASHQTSDHSLGGWSRQLMNTPHTVNYTQHRAISASSSAWHGGGAKESGESISVTFIDKEGKEHTVKAPIGSNLLDVAHDNEIDLEGACEGSLACSTCHVIVEDEGFYNKMPEPCEDELDMLDLAFGLTETSRLGCQVIATKDMDGLRVRIPAASRNFYVDGHKPKPH